mmetsp:Transcript_88070/g.179713  ORF Transcript_88070/g.179713 Transcript_88070/m.179713 type:complete len:164 (-) Transcript_88070:112-603(-)
MIDGHGAAGDSGVPATARSAGEVAERPDPLPPHSARLLDAASSTMRHLQDVAARRQAAMTALQDRISGINAIEGFSDSEQQKSQEGTKEWLKEVKEILHEAQQSGVAATIIEHARQRIKEKRRQFQEKSQACEVLKRALSKKDVKANEIRRSLHRVQRLAERH